MVDIVNKKTSRKSVDKAMKNLEDLVAGLNDIRKNPPEGFQIKLAVNSSTGLLSVSVIKIIGEE